MTTDYAHRFWLSGHYHALAQQYEQNIELTHPGAVSSNRLSPYTWDGIWGRTTVTYPTYRGESV